MRPLIVSATREEIANSIPFLEKHNIPYLITGVGMVATTYALTRYLSTNNCDLLLQVGIAGAIDRTIDIGTVIEVDCDILSELGAEDGDHFIQIKDLGFGESEYRKINLSSIETYLPKHIGITVNTIHGSEKSINNVKNLFPKASIESMEGASFFYVAHHLNIPSLQVRSISNHVEKRDKSTWNIPLAVKNINEWLVSFLQKYY
ncbi:futalosine hydrolase [Sphingobacterium rhinopitheci]|uniref:futalosine hydrolase n=1 Tax=Sphingobacterium rhinopitheci TaxID=2781960 RepID=UPI001F521722|nr:futalosine hydrolase [Sphingobacterium rhinopitheci]MCI0921566.1 futalosine hydrolase [Sphingobacterium rhinopitheci]